MSINQEERVDSVAEGSATGPPYKRQKTLSKVCETCRLKKSRCDSGRPQCDTCHRKGFECIYREKGQPGLRPGFGKAMETRLDFLERKMAMTNQSVQDILRHLGQTTTAQGPLQATDLNASASTLVNTGNYEFRREPPPTNSQAPFGLGTPSTGDTGTFDPWKSSQPNPEAGALESALTSIPVRLPSFPSEHVDVSTAARSLPSQDILEELLNIFFDLIYPWLPLFHEPSFRANMYSPEHELLLHGIVVITFRYWKDAMPLKEERDAYIKRSKEILINQTIDMCTLVSTQALALLAVDALGQGTGPRTWSLLSMLVTAARHLGLHKSHSLIANTSLVRNEDLDDELDLSKVETEEKRRLFWSICHLDRFSSVAHGQPGGIDMKTINFPYPSGEEDWGQRLSPKSFQAAVLSSSGRARSCASLWHHYVEVLAFMDRSNELLIEPVDLTSSVHSQEWQYKFRRMVVNLTSWFETLPPMIRKRPATFDPMWVTLHATFHLIRIRMYTVAAFPSTTSTHVKPSSTARVRCREAVRDVAALVESLQTGDLDRLGPMFAFVLWVATRSLIIIWTTGYERNHGIAGTDMEPLLNGLRHLSTYWPCAQRYSDLVQPILDSKDSPGGPTGLDIFNDTRRTAYGLEKRLGSLAASDARHMSSHWFDFLDMPLMDSSDSMAPWGLSFGSDINEEWLRE